MKCSGKTTREDTERSTQRSLRTPLVVCWGGGVGGLPPSTRNKHYVWFDWIHYAISSADLNTTCDAFKQTEEKASAQPLRPILTIAKIVTEP